MSDPVEINFTIPKDFSSLTDEALTELSDQAKATAKPLVDLVNGGASLDDSQLATLERLSGVVTQVTEVRNERIAKAASETGNQQRQSGPEASKIDRKNHRGILFLPVYRPQSSEPAELCAASRHARRTTGLL